ncbi:MAG: urea amidolyase [Pseudomonadota bacterium]
MSGSSARLSLLACGPLVTVQDAGRPGFLSQGLARGGAADRHALAEAAALLGSAGAAIETPGSPLTLRAEADTVLALTGAEMRADLAGRTLAWHASHAVAAGDVLTLRPLGLGTYSYVTPLGGVLGPQIMGSRAAHLIAGIGRALAPGDALEIGGGQMPPRRLSPVPDRWSGGALRIVPTPQTRLFSQAELARFEASEFARSPRGNRQGVRLDGPSFSTEGQLNLLSDFVLPGDIQMTGDGVPYILGPECQTTGGYPRIGHVIEADLPRALQAPAGLSVRFCFVTVGEARAARPGPAVTAPLVQDPRDVDLWNKQLIGGVVSAKEG